MNINRKKELIYVALAASQSIGALTWVQIAYNEPASVISKSWKEILTLLSISAVIVLAQTLTTWKAYLSNPSSEPSNVPDVSQTPPEPHQAPQPKEP